MKKIFAVCVSVCCCFSCRTDATSESRAIQAEVERYLNDLTTLEADFVQEDKRGSLSIGHFWLKRPHLMKMDYKDPPTHVVIAKGNRVTSYDRELKEKTESSVYDSPLSVLLNRKISLSEDVQVSYAKKENDAIYIKFCSKDKDADGAVLMVFSTNPLELRQWVIFESRDNELNGKRTEVSLFNWKIKHEIADAEFDRYN